jgi:DNA-binding MarR family transcriptional regulator
MTASFRELAGLDRTLHAPPRLAILTVLLTCEEADFNFLLTTTGLTKGNLASNITVLQEAGLISTRKDFSGPRSRTSYSLTGEGRASTTAHWEKLEQVKSTLPRIPRVAGT